MSRTSCLICGTKCVSCRRICQCGMKEGQVKIINDIIMSNKGMLDNAPLLIEVRGYIEDGIPQHVIQSMIDGKLTREDADIIIEEIKNGEIVEGNSLAESLGVCIYPIGSANLGKWAACIKCGKTKFANPDKKCFTVNEDEGVTVDADVTNP